MTNIDDVFNVASNAEWFMFKAVGDRVAGVFTNVEEAVDGYDNPQYVITLERDGKKQLVGIRKSHTFLVDQLKKAKYGQIIGLEFSEERPNKGRNATKIITVKQDINMKDDAWIAAKIETAKTFGQTPVEALTPDWGDTDASASAKPQRQEDVPFPSAGDTAPIAAAVPEATVEAAAPAEVDDTLFNSMKTLLVNKEIVDAASSDDEIKAKIVEITGLPLTAENGPAIINKIATA